LRGNIRVFLRCRYDNRTKCCLQFPTDTDVLPPNSKKPFAFDKVFTPQSTQDEVSIGCLTTDKAALCFCVPVFYQTCNEFLLLNLYTASYRKTTESHGEVNAKQL